MKTTLIRRLIVVVGALALVGCGGEAAMMEDTGTGGVGGQASAMGGQAGGTQTATGGAPGTGAGGASTGDINSKVFTRADHDLCMAWPVCPDDVTAPLDGEVRQVIPSTCRTAFDGRRMNCGWCQNAAGAFVGRCIAPMTVNGVRADAWMLCTGFEYQPGELNKSNSQMVCEG